MSLPLISPMNTVHGPSEMAQVCLTGNLLSIAHEMVRESFETQLSQMMVHSMGHHLCLGQENP